MRLVKRDLEVSRIEPLSIHPPNTLYHALESFRGAMPTKKKQKKQNRTERKWNDKLTNCREWHPFRGWRTGAEPPSIRNMSRPCRSWWRGSSAPNWSQSPPRGTSTTPPTRSPISSQPCCPIVSKRTCDTIVPLLIFRNTYSTIVASSSESQESAPKGGRNIESTREHVQGARATETDWRFLQGPRPSVYLHHVGISAAKRAITQQEKKQQKKSHFFPSFFLTKKIKSFHNLSNCAAYPDLFSFFSLAIFFLYSVVEGIRFIH